MAKQPINMPRFGVNNSQGDILEWLVKVGDTVEEGDFLLRITYEKGEAEIEALFNGTIAEIIAKPGETYKVGRCLGYIDATE